MKDSCYLFVEDNFKEIYYQYLNEKGQSKDYTYYLKIVEGNGKSLFDVPDVYRTDEMIKKAISTPHNPIKLPTRLQIEGLIKRYRYERGKHIPEYRKPITNEEYEGYVVDLAWILDEEYNHNLKNYYFESAHLYTFFDFYREVSSYYKGFDAICYFYLYCGLIIPFYIGEGVKDSNIRYYQLSYNPQSKHVECMEITKDIYNKLWSPLKDKLKEYYDTNVIYDNCWHISLTDLTVLPILQNGEIYSSYKTIDNDGVVCDYSCSRLISIPKGITEFVIPDGIREFDRNCFSGNVQLKKVKISSRVFEIPVAGFMDCISLEEVDLSEIDNHRIYVNSAAFCNCKSLRTIDMNKIKFEYDTQLVFAYCQSLKNIDGLIRYYSNKNSFTFYHCDSLQGTINCDDSDFGGFDFAFCKNISSIINIRNDIFEGQFLGCENLKSVEYKYGYGGKIQNYGFAGCVSLEYIDITGGRISLIGDFAFDNCRNLNKIIVDKKSRETIKISSLAFDKETDAIMLWSDPLHYDEEEPIREIIDKQAVELKKQEETENKYALKTKNDFICAYDGIAHCNKKEKKTEIIGRLFKEYGDYMGHKVNTLLSKKICSYEELLNFGTLFYECIDYCGVNENRSCSILEAIVVWAKSFTVQALIKANIHEKHVPIRLLYKIVSKSHNILLDYLKSKRIYDKSNAPSYDLGIMSSSIDTEKIRPKLSVEEEIFINKINVLPDIRVPYLIEMYLLYHIININNYCTPSKHIISEEGEDMERIKETIDSYNKITNNSLLKICRIVWKQYVSEIVENSYLEMGEIDISPYTNTESYISFDDDKGIICRKDRAMIEKYPMGIDIVGIESKENSEFRHSDINIDDTDDYYSGTWAHDVEGYSDDDIDTIFDGEPDAYWNID